MLEYPRWKYLLVAAVLLLALLFALPNFFGEDPALQVARKDHAAISDTDARSLEGFLRQRSVHFIRSYLDSGRLMVRFASVPDQLAARDAVNEQYQGTYITALSFAPRTPELLRALGLRPMPLGLDLRGGLYLLYQVDVNAAVSQALEGYAQDARRALAGANIPVKDVAVVTLGSDRPNAVRVVLPPEADVNAARSALTTTFQGLDRQHREPRQRLGRQRSADHRADPRAPGLCHPAEHHHAAQPRQRAGRVRADRAAPGRRPHQRAAARRAELGRGQGHPRPGGDARVSPRGHAAQPGGGTADRARAARLEALYAHPLRPPGAAQARGDRHR